MKKDLKIIRGKTFELELRWQQRPIVYKPITGITRAGSAVVEAVGHGIPDGWLTVVTDVKGVTGINAKDPLRITGRDYRVASYVDPDHVELNDFNTAGLDDYISGGFIQYFTPVDLTGYTARMKIKDGYGGSTLIELTTANFMILIDAAAYKTRVVIPASTTELITWDSGVYDLEMVSPDTEPVVTEAISGAVVVEDEVTTA